jgi:hypothetical protein
MNMDGNIANYFVERGWRWFDFSDHEFSLGVDNIRILIFDSREGFFAIVPREILSDPEHYRGLSLREYVQGL